MKARLLIFLLAFGIQSGLRAQTATEGRLEFDKGQKVAAVIEVPYDEEVVEKAIKDFMSKKGVKSDKSKGFLVFKNAKVVDEDLEVADLYFKVDRKSRKEKNESRVSLVVGRPGENVGLRTADDRHQIDNAVSLLNAMIATVNSYGLDAEIAAQEEILKKAERRLRSIEDDQADTQKRIKNLEDKLEELRTDQRKQIDEVAKQRSTLDAMKSRKRG